jgi:hypothetical protein
MNTGSAASQIKADKVPGLFEYALDEKAEAVGQTTPIP